MSDERMGDGGDFPSTRKPTPRRPGSRGEFDFINRIRRREQKRLNAETSDSSLITHRSSLLQGIGDDAAVISQLSGFETLITTDLLVEGIDFDLDSYNAQPRDIGHKALAVSLSDIAAMGARPRWALLSVGVPRARWDTSFLDKFYQGVFALADKYEVSIIGGDISRTPERVVVDSIVLGEARRGRAVMRSGARPGDLIYVTGLLGGAAAGLRILQERARTRNATRFNRAERQLVLRQTRPMPRVEWGRVLGEEKLATAMIDVSDGLSSDLAHLCRESGVGANIEASRIPFDPLIKRAGVDADSLSLALDGGEDFELLFTIRPRDTARVEKELGGVAATRIGEVTDARLHLTLVEDGAARTLRPQGFEHFRRKQR